MEIYKIYITETVWKKYRTVYSEEEVFKTLDYLVNEVENFMVIKNDGLADIPFITNIREYIRIKEGNENVSRGTEKVYRKT